MDRFGLGWREELAAAIWSALDRIDVLEVLADDYLGAPASGLRALRTLGRQVPVTLHGTGLGLASTEPVDPRRLDRLARVIGGIEPEFWSEHLAFVRGGGIEVGHLAAPPRNASTIDGAARNIDASARIVGSRPAMENIATLVEPPRSDLDEGAWLSQCLDAARVPLLLDLHNLHANAVNFGFDPIACLRQLPLDRIAEIHLAGGHWIERSGVRRLLDDHVHDVPDPVYGLLEEVASRATGPLTVVIERDGRYPDLDDLLRQLDHARAAVAAGRARPKRERRAPCTGRSLPRPGLEAELARVYVDAEARADWLAREPGVDAVGIEMAAGSFARKRALKASAPTPSASR